MQPSKTTVTGLFNSPHQYQIPIFQRGYVWTLEKQVALCGPTFKIEQMPFLSSIRCPQQARTLG